MFSQQIFTILENSPDPTNDMVCVELIGELDVSIDVSVRFEEDSATTEDFSNTDRIFTFDSGSERSQCFPLETIEDSLFENDEVYRISLSSASDVVDVISNTVEVTIQDSSELIVGFEMSGYNVTEGDTLLACVRILSGGLAEQVALTLNVMPSGGQIQGTL